MDANSSSGSNSHSYSERCWHAAHWNSGIASGRLPDPSAAWLLWEGSDDSACESMRGPAVAIALKILPMAIANRAEIKNQQDAAPMISSTFRSIHSPLLQHMRAPKIIGKWTCELQPR